VFLYALYFMPLFALVQRKSERRFVEHAVFSLHFVSLFLVAGLILLGGAGGVALQVWMERGGRPSPGQMEVAISAPTLLASAVWLTLANRRFYGNGRAGALGRALLVLALSVLPTALYRFTLFYVTYRVVQDARSG
jgi:hypothetical protein